MNAEKRDEFNLIEFSEYLYQPRLIRNLTANILPQFAADGALQPEQGLKVYRRTLVFSLIEVLEDIFPVLKKVLTDDVFKFCARNYIYNNPSRDYNLNKYGKTLPDFIQQQKELKEHPYLYDLGRLEYALHQCYYAKSDEALSLETFKSQVKKDSEGLKLRLRLSCDFIQTTYSVHNIWDVYQDENSNEKAEALQGSFYYLILQDNYAPVYYPVETEILEIIGGILNELSLKELVQLPSVKKTPDLLNKTLGLMMARNWLAAF